MATALIDHPHADLAADEAGDDNFVTADEAPAAEPPAPELALLAEYQNSVMVTVANTRAAIELHAHDPRVEVCQAAVERLNDVRHGRPARAVAEALRAWAEADEVARQTKAVRGQLGQVADLILDEQTRLAKLERAAADAAGTPQAADTWKALDAARTKDELGQLRRWQTELKQSLTELQSQALERCRPVAAAARAELVAQAQAERAQVVGELLAVLSPYVEKLAAADAVAVAADRDLSPHELVALLPGVLS